MKFMQKTASKLQQEVEEEEIGALEEQWVIESLPAQYLALMSKVDPPEEGDADHELFEYVNSITVLEQLNFGRFSFQGMNPEVETLMRNEGKSEVEENDDENAETTVTDEDMANQYSSFVKNMDKKFKTKRQRQNESSDEDEQEDAVKKQKTPNKIIGEVKTFLKPKEY